MNGWIIHLDYVSITPNTALKVMMSGRLEHHKHMPGNNARQMNVASTPMLKSEGGEGERGIED